MAYPAKLEILGPLYQFVREHPDLFDEDEAVVRVGLLYDYNSVREFHSVPGRARGVQPPVYDVALQLANANIPFGMVVAGGGAFRSRADRERCGTVRISHRRGADPGGGVATEVARRPPAAGTFD